MNNEEKHKQIKDLLQQAIAPVTNTEPPRDLWPQMLARLQHQAVRVPWFDWVLAAVLGAILFLFPGAIPALLYHL
jgi:hypothetical protein